MIVSTAGGIEEDFIKCLAPTFLGEFSLPGKELRHKGVNRIGNLLVPNDNYCKFEEWIMPILDTLLEEQKTSVSSVGHCSIRPGIMEVKNCHVSVIAVVDSVYCMKACSDYRHEELSFKSL